MISLCLIVGNEEKYIERCLTSFKPVADEICIVRAIGNQEPDRTIEIAASKFGARVEEYKNKWWHRRWPHLDNFAAARQQSFDMARGDYIFWCDADDILEAGADVAREHAGRNGHVAFIFPYNIFGRGMMVPRERMVLRGSGRWEAAVHEHYKFNIEPVQAIEDNRVIVRHQPESDKQGSNDRNLRIMRSIPEKEMTTSLLYHLHTELTLANDIEGSITAAKKVLARPDLGKAEKCELFINLSRAAQLEKDFTTEAAFLHQAYQADPCRREALLLLCNNAMNTGKAEPALAYARQFKATPPPSQTDWNNRAPLYGWVGDDMFSQALRLNGRYDEAEAVRRETLNAAGGPRIALIHATRGRAEKAARTRKIWLDLAKHPAQVEHIFIVDEDDPDARILRRFHHIAMPPGGGCVAAWNQGAGTALAPVLVQLSDDWTPPPMWDDIIIERIGYLSKPKVLAISDGHRKDDLLCMAICTASYIALDYFMFHPWFTGVYSDNWFTRKAYERGAVIDARDVVFKHHHPLLDKSIPTDATYEAQNAPARYAEGKATYDLLCRGNDWTSVDGFFNYWSFYRQIAQQLKDGDIVAEIGVWMGRSIIYLAQECKRLGKNVKFIAVDTFKGEDNQPAHEKVVKLHGGNFRAAFENNIDRCGVGDCIEIVEATSREAAKEVSDNHLAFCFIDAAHDYGNVCADIKAWLPKVKKGGILAGHDADHEPVRRAVKELLPNARIALPVWINPIQN